VTLEGRIPGHVEDAGTERILTAEKDDDATSTVLKSHLTRYVSENSMDYFVHKDLENSLRANSISSSRTRCSTSTN